MDLVVGASESTVKSLLGKLTALLAQEYTLIRGVGGDLQYITDELRTMQSFLIDMRNAKRDQRMTDWMKQVRDMTYDVEDCIDDSGHRIHNPRWLRSDMCCYFLLNSVYEVFTWWPRRDIASKISDLKLRAEHISQRRKRYGVDNVTSRQTDPEDGGGPSTGFNTAENQDTTLKLVATAHPVGVGTEIDTLTINEAKKEGVLAIVGFGGLGKTIIATDLYRKLGDEYDCRAIVTVSQSSDLEAILTSIKEQVIPQSDDQNRFPAKKGLTTAFQSFLNQVKCRCCIDGTPDNSTKQEKLEPDSGNQVQQEEEDDSSEEEEKNLSMALRKKLRRVRQCSSDVVAKCCVCSTSKEAQDNAKLRQLRDDLKGFLSKNRYLLLIDDVWSASTFTDIRRSLPPEIGSKGNLIIVTTRFQAVATTSTGNSKCIHNVKALDFEKSQKLFLQAVSESNNKTIIKELPEKVRNICGGLPLALVTMAGYIGCNTADKGLDKLLKDLSDAEGRKDGGLSPEEAGRIIRHCYNDMPAEIQTCSLYLSIFPKGKKISRKRLTRRWIAEGFISEKDGLSLEDVAETYFNHLIRRKIVRPVEHSSNGKVKNCVVHDMILEHIVAKASDENFNAVIGGHWLMQPPSSKVRRLSLQGGDVRRVKGTENMNLFHVRSVTMFGSLDQLSLHSFKFRIVQVLDLEGCTDFRPHHTNEICNMIFLKYLSLRATNIKKLPKAIRKLDKLETLDIRETNIDHLPSAICNLARLVNLLGGNKRTHKALRLPKELVMRKKMTALRILSGIEIVDASADLHHLTELRKLAIYRLGIKKRGKAFKDLRSSIQYLGGLKLHTLIIYEEPSQKPFLQSLEDPSTNPPNSLIALELSGKMVKLPSWINKLYSLNKLTLSLILLKESNLSVLKNFEALFSLTFTSSAAQQDQEAVTIIENNRSGPDGEIVVPPGGFTSLKLLRVTAPRVPLLHFSRTAMPCLERLDLRFSMLEGLRGTENLKDHLKEVHLIVQMRKRKEHENDMDFQQIKEMIKKDMKGFTSDKEDGNDRKVIFHQYHD